jgi:hypothetical protein
MQPESITPCDRCGEEGRPQVCPGDGRYHHHGCVHTASGGFQWLCDPCRQTAADEWTARKLLNEIAREAATPSP